MAGGPKVSVIKPCNNIYCDNSSIHSISNCKTKTPRKALKCPARQVYESSIASLQTPFLSVVIGKVRDCIKAEDERVCDFIQRRYPPFPASEASTENFLKFAREVSRSGEKTAGALEVVGKFEKICQDLKIMRF